MLIYVLGKEISSIASILGVEEDFEVVGFGSLAKQTMVPYSGIFSEFLWSHFI